MIRRAAAVFVVLALLLCAACRVPEPESLRLENETMRVDVLNPAERPARRTVGCRFILGGWLKRLQFRDSGRELFKSRTVHPRLPAFGLAFEFFPGPEFSVDPETGGVTRLQYGVGIVEQEAGKRFETRPLEYFPWRGGLTAENVLTAYQSADVDAGYAYKLSVRVELHHAGILIYWFDMRNTGCLPIETEFYAHPFFEAADGLDGWRFRLPGAAWRAVADAPCELETGGFRNSSGEQGVWIETPDGIRCSIRVSVPLSRAVFWKNGRDCFAVEPFIPVCIPPGGRKQWRYLLTVSGVQRAE